jgi:hypothetical protein
MNKGICIADGGFLFNNRRIVFPSFQVRPTHNERVNFAEVLRAMLTAE